MRVIHAVADIEDQSINDLLLDISFAAESTHLNDLHLLKTASSASALAAKCINLKPKDLKGFIHIILPLMIITRNYVNDPVSSKTALCLKILISSQVCMKNFIENEGLSIIDEILCEMIGTERIGLKNDEYLPLIGNLLLCSREISRFYPQELVHAGILKHLVRILRFGNLELKSIVLTILTPLSQDLQISKQIYINGAIKPLIAASDSDNTNEGCMMAGLGCLIQLCRIPEIAVNLVKNSLVNLLEKALYIDHGHSVSQIREKAVYAIAWLSRIPSTRGYISTINILKAVRRELRYGTEHSRFAVVSMLLNLHATYPYERSFMISIREFIQTEIVHGNSWRNRNICIKAFCVFFKEDEDKFWFFENGLYDAILELMESKPLELQEVSLVALLSLCTHQKIPIRLIGRGCVGLCIPFLQQRDEILKSLSIVLLKTFYIYNSRHVITMAPPEHIKLIDPSDEDTPMVFGEELGGVTLEYLQLIISNRRKDEYLVEDLTDEIIRLKLSENEIYLYQTAFMELDFKCMGYLGIDELKLIMILLGVNMDKDELDDLFNEYDTEKTGKLSFYKFILIMKSWKTRFGTGVTKFFTRGAIGKARRSYRLWKDKDVQNKLEAQKVREKLLESTESIKENSKRYLQHESLRLERIEESELRSSRLSTYNRKL